MSPEDEKSCSFQTPETWTEDGVFSHDGLTNFVNWLKQLKTQHAKDGKITDCAVQLETEGGETFCLDGEEIEEWADKTILHWGHNPRLSFQAHTRGAAIKGVWQDEATKRTIPKRTAQ